MPLIHHDDSGCGREPLPAGTDRLNIPIVLLDMKESVATPFGPNGRAVMLRSTYGETKVDAAIMQPAIDLAVKYGGMRPVSAADLIWLG